MSGCSDVVVVGAGVIGNACAYYLAKRGFSVTVLEAGANIGDGGSSRNGGGVRQSGRDVRELPLAVYGIKHLWPGLSDELGVDCEYVQGGNLRLGKTPAHLEVLKRLADAASGCGVGVEMVDGDEVRRINPYLSEEVIGASWCPTDGHANPLSTTLGLYMKARQLGARFITGVKVTGLRKLGGRIAQVDTDEGPWTAKTVIVAAGMGSREVLASAGVDVPMRPELIEALVTEAQPAMFPQMLGTAEADFYGHQTKHGSFVFGGECSLEGFTKDNGTPVNTSITAPAICRGVIRYFPALEQAKVVRTWAGWMDRCADGVPVVGAIDEVPGLLVACGFTGHGFGIAPAVGLCLSQLAAGEQPACDISGLAYDRFHAKA